MSIKSNLEKHTVSWLKRQDDEGMLKKNISIQRQEVWDIVKKSNLIVSILLDIPVESLLFEENDKEFNVLDGKQRIITLCAFLSDKFSLSPNIKVKKLDGMVLTGLSYSQMPENLKNKILEYELSIAILRPLDIEDRAIVFFMRNQAVSLSKMDLSRVLLGEEAMTSIQALCEHNFMKSKIKLTEVARNKNEDMLILIQFLILSTQTNTGFSGTEVMNFCDDVKNKEIDIASIDLLSILNYLDESVPEKKQYLKKVHLPMAIYIAREAMVNGISPEQFYVRLDAFLSVIKENVSYMEACNSGCAKRTNVYKRLEMLKKIL